MNLYYFINSIKKKRYSADHHVHDLVEQVISRYGRREKKYDKTVYKNEEFDIKIYSLTISPELLDAELHLEKKSTIKSKMPLFVRKFMHTKLKFPLINAIKHESVMHYFNVPTYKTTKKVKTILELPTIKELTAPEFFNNGINLFNNIKLIDMADLLITHSDYMARQISSKLFINEAKIKVIPRGISSGITEHDVEQYRLPEKFILFSGRVLPYKNLERLFSAFQRVAPKGVSIVVAGDASGSYMEELKRSVAPLVDNKIKFIGYVSKDIMPSIMKRALALVDPSHVDDFPETIIEAQSLGIPVIASDIEAHKSVCKDSILYFSSISEKEIAESIEAVLSDKSTRNTLIKAGNINSEKYHWDNIATMYRDLYKTL